jgi:hypothetical protein
MKTILIILFAFILSCSSTEQSGTTIEEYNYATNGLIIQLNSGLDVKKGYILESIDTLKLYDKYRVGEGMVFNIMKLIRNNNAKYRTAAFIIRYGYISNFNIGKPDKGNYCIVRPESSKEVMDLYQNAILEKTDDNFLHGFIFVLNSVVEWD